MQPERGVRRDDKQEREQAAPAAPVAASPDAARILTLQRSAGNAAVSRLLQRDSLSGNDYMAARRAKEAWVRGGVRGPMDFVASTSRGGFQVAYLPSVGNGALSFPGAGLDRAPALARLDEALQLAIAQARSPD